MTMSNTQTPERVAVRVESFRQPDDTLRMQMILPEGGPKGDDVVIMDVCAITWPQMRESINQMAEVMLTAVEQNEAEDEARRGHMN